MDATETNAELTEDAAKAHVAAAAGGEPSAGFVEAASPLDDASSGIDYLDYWGLARPPFSLAPCPNDLYLSKQHGECLMRLKYAIVAGKGGALLISENAGDGKTTVLRRLSKDLPEDLGGNVRTAFLDHPTLTPTQMLQEISRQLGVAKPPRSKIQALNRFREHLEAMHAQGEKCVVIVDEGQMLEHRPDLLQELRILLNFCVSDSFLLSFILSGQSALEPVVRSMPEFWQRLPVRFFLKNLDFPDTRELIRHRLGVAGLSKGREIFATEAYEEIHRLSEGCPRVICSVADLALVVGRSAMLRDIGAAQVRRAWADMEKKDSDGFHYFHFLDGMDAKPTGMSDASLADDAKPLERRDERRPPPSMVRTGSNVPKEEAPTADRAKANRKKRGKSKAKRPRRFWFSGK